MFAAVLGPMLFLLIGAETRGDAGSGAIDPVQEAYSDLSKSREDWLICADAAIPPLVLHRDVPASDAAAAALDGCEREAQHYAIYMRIVYLRTGRSEAEAIEEIERDRVNFVRSLASKIVKMRANAL